jgi:hypothetical protein
MNTTFKLVLLGSTLALAVGPASAQEYDLCAGPTTKEDLPDGSSVAMWGYATGGAIGGVCENVPTIPGPPLPVPPGDSTLTINLTNTLPEPTSIVIPGLPMPSGGPFWDDNSSGSRCANMTDFPDNCTALELAKRVRSFGAEVASGAEGSYAFTVGRPGSFIYHSGTHPQKQVYMGLYGPVTQDAVAAAPPALAEAYPGVPYAQEILLFYSEIDPDLNASIDELYNPTGTVDPYTTSIDYHPQWFLVNGEPYSTDCSDVQPPINGEDDLSGYPCLSMVQTPDIAAGAAKTPTLLRFFSAAGKTHVPTLQGMHMSIHAEDANLYGWEDTAAATSGNAPLEQYSLMLPPLKTKDAIIEPQLEGRYALYDGNGYMTNPTDPSDFQHQDTVGGMLRFLSVGADGNAPPVGVMDEATVVETGTVTIDVLANDSDPEGQPLTIDAHSAATAGTVTCTTGVVGGTCEYTAGAGSGAPTFTYTVSDGVNTTTGVPVTVTVLANVAPTANDDSATTDTATPVVVNVLDNDVGQIGETLAIGSFDATSANNAAVSCDTVTGDCTYTPDGVFTGDDTFTYTATDGTLLSAAATVTITVNAVAGNAAPVANDDAYNVIEDGILSVAAGQGVLANDTDDDGDPLTATLVSGPANAAGFNLQATGAFFYQPNPNFNGEDTFTYMANDGTANSNVATVTITVDTGNDIPTANSDEFFLKSMYALGEVTTVPAPGVLANDTDVDGDTLTAVLDTDVGGPAVLGINPPDDGGFTYTTGDPENATVGTVDTFTYFANDGSVNSTAPATVDLVRKLSVSQAVCEFSPQAGGRCDWVIEGNKLDAATARIQAYIAGTGTLIGQTPPNVGAGPWTLTVNNSQVVLETGDTIDVRVLGDSDAEILAFPIVQAP